MCCIIASKYLKWNGYQSHLFFFSMPDPPLCFRILACSSRGREKSIFSRVYDFFEILKTEFDKFDNNNIPPLQFEECKNLKGSNRLENEKIDPWILVVIVSCFPCKNLRIWQKIKITWKYKNQYLIYNFFNTISLQEGQQFLSHVSHGSIHFVWNKCAQRGNKRTISFDRKSNKQMEHVSHEKTFGVVACSYFPKAFKTLLWRDVICDKFL